MPVLTRPVIRPLLALTLAAGVLLVADSPAAATPTDCSTTVHTNRHASSFCASGTGEHRIVVWGFNIIEGARGSRSFAGQWVPVGQTSHVQLFSQYIIRDPVRIETREPASPPPSSDQCVTHKESDRLASSFCPTSVGEHRVKVFGFNIVWGARESRYFFGRWMPGGLSSFIQLPSSYVIRGEVQVEVRN